MGQGRETAAYTPEIFMSWPLVFLGASPSQLESSHWVWVKLERF